MATSHNVKVWMYDNSYMTSLTGWTDYSKQKVMK